MRIGIVTAMAQETLPIYTKLGKILDEGIVAGATVYHIDVNGDEIFLAKSGVGELRAAITTQMLIDIFEVEVVMNFGFVGAINKKLNVGDMVLVGAVVHYQFDTSEIDKVRAGQYDERKDLYFHASRKYINRLQTLLPRPMKIVIDASGDKFIGNSKDKKYLATFGADICEMELAGIAMACERNDIPFLSIKVVSDSADEKASVSFSDVVTRGLVGLDVLFPQIFSAITGKKNEAFSPIKRK